MLLGCTLVQDARVVVVVLHPGEELVAVGLQQHPPRDDHVLEQGPVHHSRLFAVATVTEEERCPVGLRAAPRTCR
jgi:hypothetical protein